jgi:protein-disulfide isomerase
MEVVKPPPPGRGPLQSEFECPFCARFAADTLPALEKTYVATGKVLLAFRHFPLERIHPSAMQAAEAAECAGSQGRFWEMHDLLFQSPKQLDRPSLDARARALGLDQQAFGRCLNGQRKIRQEASAAAGLKVSGTPTFFIGSLSDGQVTVAHRVSGAQPFASFQRILDDLLSTAAAGTR